MWDHHCTAWNKHNYHTHIMCSWPWSWMIWTACTTIWETASAHKGTSWEDTPCFLDLPEWILQVVSCISSPLDPSACFMYILSSSSPCRNIVFISSCSNSTSPWVTLVKTAEWMYVWLQERRSHCSQYTPSENTFWQLVLSCIAHCPSFERPTCNLSLQNPLADIPNFMFDSSLKTPSLFHGYCPFVIVVRLDCLLVMARSPAFITNLKEIWSSFQPYLISGTETLFDRFKG